MNFAATIATLRTELKTKNEELAAVILERDARPTAEQVTALNSQVTDLQGQVTTLTATNTELQTKLAAMEKNVEGQVVDRIAAAGVPAIAKTGEAENGTQEKSDSGLTGLARVTAAFARQKK